MCQQGVAAVKHTGNGVHLMFSQMDIGIHAGEGQVRSIVLSRHKAVELIIVNALQFSAPRRVFVHPLLKGVFQKFLLVLRDDCFLAVDNADLSAVNVFGFSDLRGFQVQAVLQNTVAVPLFHTKFADRLHREIVERFSRDIVVAHQRIVLNLDIG